MLGYCCRPEHHRSLIGERCEYSARGERSSYYLLALWPFTVNSLWG